MALIDHALRIAAEAHPFDHLDGIHDPADDADTTYVTACLAGGREARDVLPLFALIDALGPAGLRRLQAPEGLALVVQVPGPEWAPRIETVLRGLTQIAHIFVRSGASKAERPSEGNEKAGSLLSQGAKVAGISHSPDRYLPATLVQCADLFVRVGQPSNRIVSAVIRAVTGKRARRMPSTAVAAGLSFDTITAAIRLGTTPAACIARLQAAGRSLSGCDGLDDVPNISELWGYGAAGVWASNLVHDLDEWRAGRLEWKDIQRTCCLSSEPGLGKSSLVRSIAKSARLPLVTMMMSELFTSSSGHLDGVLKSMDNRISQAAAQAPALLYIDECDSIPNRETMDNRGRDWWVPVVNGILAALDSTVSGPASRLIVIGATNHADKLDQALIRPGRLFPVIHIGRPDADALVGIMRQHLGCDLAGVDLVGVAHLGAGATGADVTAWVKGARATARAQGRRMILDDLVGQVAPPDPRTPEELMVTALHEAAHCLAAAELSVASLSTVSIAMGPASGGSARARLKPRAYLTRTQLEDIAVVALAGRAVDALTGLAHTGAGGGRESDLARATEIVLSIHATYGLGESLVVRGPAEVAVDMRVGSALRRTVDAELLQLYRRASDLCREHLSTIEAIAHRLVAARVLTGDEVAAIIESHRKPAAGRGRGGRNA